MRKIIYLSFLLFVGSIALAQTNLTLTSLPLQVTVNEGVAATYQFNAPISQIISRNPGVVSWTINGNSVSFTGLKSGRTGLNIVSNGQHYFMGLRVNHSNGTIPGLPQYLSIGSVSEDLAGDLSFWEDSDTDATNKACDIRYIYINGGAIGGWQSWGPNRPGGFARESLKHGLIPFFVYYNIPDNGESYQLDLAHAQDPVYMTAYFQDLNNFMDSVQNVMNGELYGIILEPDFLGYMQQNAVPNDPSTIPTAVSATSIATNAGTISSLVGRINQTIADKRSAGHKIFFGWQLNLWSYQVLSGNKGICRRSDQLNIDAAAHLVKVSAEETTLYGMKAGILSHGADFISIDKYGLDAMGQNNTPDPFDCTWFFNNDHWLNYLKYANTIHKTSNKPVILWQLPVGRVNQSTYISAYTGQTFADVDNTPTKYEDSSTDFFLGDDFTPTDPLRINYFTQNKWNDPKLMYAWGSGQLRWRNHLQETKDAGIISALFGAGVNASTDGVGSPPSDNYFWIQKVQDYYTNGTIPLAQAYGENALNPCSGGCPPIVQFISPIDGGKIYRSELDTAKLKFLVQDWDGTISSLIVKIDGQTVSTTNNSELYIVTWSPPSSFGTHTLSVVATDNNNLTTSSSLNFEIIDFDAAACGYPEWNSTQIYNTAGNIISYNALIYKNKWYTVGDKPFLGGSDSPWELEGVCTVLLDSTTNILPKLKDKSLDFYVFPNPVTEAFSVYFPYENRTDLTLSLYDANGKIVYVRHFAENEEREVQRGNWAAGVYYLQAESGERRSGKVIMMR